jgi:hypothetical protein
MYVYIMIYSPTCRLLTPTSCRTMAARSAFWRTPSHRSTLSGTLSGRNSWVRHSVPKFSVDMSWIVCKDDSIDSWKWLASGQKTRFICIVYPVTTDDLYRTLVTYKVPSMNLTFRTFCEMLATVVA